MDSAHDTNKAPNERYTDRHHQSSPTFIKSNNFAPSDTYGRYVRRMQRYASVDTLNDNNVIADEYIRLFILFFLLGLNKALFLQNFVWDASVAQWQDNYHRESRLGFGSANAALSRDRNEGE